MVLAGGGGLRIQLLGAFRVWVDGQAIVDDAWRPKAAQLVQILALAPQHRVHRDEMSDALWPDFAGDAATNNLYRLLYDVRRVLHSAGQPRAYVPLRRGELVLGHRQGSVWVDVDAFEQAARAARSTNDPEPIRRAIRLYSGALLPADPYADRIAQRRAELRAMYIDLLDRVAQLQESQGQLEAARQALQDLIAEEPTDQTVHARLMHVYARLGRRQTAIQHYLQLRNLLQSELETIPGPAIEQLYRRLQAGEDLAEPLPGPPRVPAETSGQRWLPKLETSFVGRSAELLIVAELIQAARLVTLTGAGGIGKTRLAHQVALERAAYPAEAVRWVDLGSLPGGEFMAPAVLQTLGARESSDSDPIESVVAVLRTETMLLVLDNAEHVVDACRELVAQVLAECPGIRVLLTSRVPLRMPAETVWNVPALGLPDTNTNQAPEQLSGIDAVRLFVERGRAAAPTFALTTATAPDVARICRGLDGIPLAIELAATRLNIAGIDDIARRLDDVLHLLTRGGQLVVSRHQTLRATLDWSFNLLTPPAQLVLRRLSVFAGGFTLQAAEAVCAADDAERSLVLNALSDLVDNSLVVSEPSGATRRLRLLEVVRQYALEHLHAAAEEPVTRLRHLTWFRQLGELAEPELVGAAQADWLDRVAEEHDNLRSALEWGIAGGDPDAALRLAGAIYWFWNVRGHLPEGRRWAEAVLAAAPAAAPGWRSKVHHAAGVMAMNQGALSAADAHLQSALDLRRTLGDTRGVLRTLSNIAVVAYMRDGAAAARPLFEECLTLSRGLNDDHQLGNALNNLGAIARELGELEQARALFGEAVAVRRTSGDETGLARAMVNLGILAVRLEDYRSAAADLDAGIALALDLGARDIVAYGLEAMAEVALLTQQPGPAAHFLGAAEVLRDELGVPTQSVDEAAALQRLTAAVRSASGETAFADAIAVGRALSLVAVADEARAVATALEVPLRSASGMVRTHLTEREREVANLVATGLSNRQIATQLHIARRTVDTHVSRILHKLKLVSRAELATQC